VQERNRQAMRLSHVQLAVERSSIALIALGGSGTKASANNCHPKPKVEAPHTSKSPLQVGIAASSRRRSACVRERDFLVSMSVTNREFADAKSLWKLYYAKRCFEHAENTCNFLLEHAVHEDHPIYYPLAAAIYVLYGKPFKDTNLVGMLGEKIVPAEFRKPHAFMLNQRDQIYAHTDPESFDIPGKGPANQVRVRIRSAGSTREARLVGTEFFARPPTLEEVAKLCRAMQKQADIRVGELQTRNFAGKLPKEDGEYPLNVFDREGSFLLPKASDPFEHW
jgi:hypothetical protein